MKICKHSKKSKEQIYKHFTEKQNKSQKKKFSSVPFEKRIIFAPHCMRNSAVCRAQEKDSYYICKDCGGCTIGKISKMAEKLGYAGLFIVKGGRTLSKLTEQCKPDAIVGIACYYEGELGFNLFKDTGIAVQYVPLTKDGCVSTDADIDEIEKILTQII